MPKVPAGHAVVEAAVAEGVTDIFSLLGHANLAIIDGFYGREDVRYIGVRHEQAGALMGDGYARASGLPGVFISTCGPGTTNVVTAAAAAQVAQSPLVIVGGGTPEEYAFRDAFQEFDLVSLLRPVTKFAGRLTIPERIPEMMRHIFRVATSGKKGPVFLELPEDKTAAGSTAEIEDIPPRRYRVIDPRPEGDSASIEAAAATLREARRPVLLAGGGVVWGEGTDAATDLADLIGAALVTSYARNDALPNDHPRFLGALGRAGAPEAVEAVQEADVLLALGTRLAHMTGFFDHRYINADTRIVQVEIDGNEIGRNYPIEVGILGDARAVAARLLETLRRQIDGAARNEEWQTATVERNARRRARLEREAQNDSMPVKPQRVYGELRKAMPPDTVYTLDAGAVSAMGYDRLHFTEPKTFFSPLYIGSLGVGLPIAMGSKGRAAGQGGRLDQRRRRVPVQLPGATDGDRVRHQRRGRHNEQRLLGRGEEHPGRAVRRAARRSRHQQSPLRQVRGGVRSLRLLRRAPRPDRGRAEGGARLRQARDRGDTRRSDGAGRGREAIAG